MKKMMMCLSNFGDCCLLASIFSLDINCHFCICLKVGQTSDPNVERCDSRAEILKEDQDLATSFIQTLFAVLYEVYSSSVSATWDCMKSVLSVHVEVQCFAGLN